MLIKQTLQFIGWHVLPLLYHANGVGNKILLCTGSCSTVLHWSVQQMIPIGGYFYSTLFKKSNLLL